MILYAGIYCRHLLKGVKSDWSFECSVESEGLAWKGFFAVPTSINTAWLSVASCIGILMVYMKEGLPKPAWAAVVLAGVATAAGDGHCTHLAPIPLECVMTPRALSDTPRSTHEAAIGD